MNTDQVAKAVSDSKIVGLGESTHGTREFFSFKSELFRQLVANHGFNTLLFEDSIKACRPINDYILGEDIDLMSACGNLYPVWQTEELKDLVVQLRNNRPPSGVAFVGFDIDQAKRNDLSQRDELMAGNIKAYCDANPGTKAAVWAHNSHIQSVGSDIQPRPMGYFLKQLFGQQYESIALLFGSGSVSATRLESGKEPGSDRTLSAIEIGPPPSNLAESHFGSLAEGPTFFDRDQLARMKMLNRVRSIGWGLVPELASQSVEKTDLKQAFDHVIYFPDGSHSRPLLGVEGR